MILLTGHNGFIGSNFLKRLDYKDTFVVGDQFYKISQAPWSQIEKVYHLGAISDTTENNIEKLYKANIKYSIDLFDICIERNIPIVYASSASVYGNSLVFEMNPLNYYSLSKAVVDLKAADYIQKGANIVGMRFFNVYGDGEEHKGTQASPIHQFTKQAKETGVIKVFEGSEDFYRDFVWVEDVIDCMLTDKKPGIYDVGTSRAISFLKVAELIAEKYGAKIEVIPFPDKLRDKYQTYTRARTFADKKFITVEGYVKEIQ